MENKMVTVIYDRRKLSEKKGMGYVEVRVNLGHKVRKYITLCYTSPAKWKKEAASDEAKLLIKKCEDILTAMSVLGEESNIENFNKHFSGESMKPTVKKQIEEPKKATKPEEFVVMRMALSHNVPIENVARMLGHQDIKTTQIYAKVLRSTIERHATALQNSII